MIKKEEKTNWEFGKFNKLEDARSFAIEHGWRANPQRVQVRRTNDGYYIEPYEGKDCKCSNIIPPF
jgi:hypothetical protein